jgi:GntR family transcriptional repressor for pyruvate dehydrogenase complex
VAAEFEAGTRRRPQVPLHTPRVAEAMAGQLRLRILEGDLVDGSELPTEAQLLEEFPVSRPSLREAIRILETEGLLKVRRGKRGGTVITGPSPDTAAYHMGLLLHSRSTPITDLAAARKLLEPLCAEQAAAREDHEQVGTALRQLTERCASVVEDGFAFTNEAIAFHEALVDAAGNETLRVITGMLETVWAVQEKDWARKATEEEKYPDVPLRTAVLKAHRAISDAITKGYVEHAVRLTRDHLEASQLYVAPDESRSVRVLSEYGNSRMSDAR